MGVELERWSLESKPWLQPGVVNSKHLRKAPSGTKYVVLTDPYKSPAFTHASSGKRDPSLIPNDLEFWGALHSSAHSTGALLYKHFRADCTLLNRSSQASIQELAPSHDVMFQNFDDPATRGPQTH